MINWDVRAKTALSDEEVIRKETRQKLYHIRYPLVNETGDGAAGHIIIATVRPETIMGDTAICVHPDDERYKRLHGKFALVPLVNRRIPIITDEYVSMEFGTGALKVTPAHDMNDNQLGQKHQLEVVDIFNDDGTLSEAAQIFVGEERFEARKKVVQRLEQEQFLEKVEDYTSEVGFSERTDTVVEPRLSMQWWLKMKGLSVPALRSVMEEHIRFYPPKYKNTYRHWMENIRDWCISRQLWWGHRIPVWYDEKGNVYVAESLEALYREQPDTVGLSLRQDEDCLDTWFSSWLWPFEVFKGFSDPGNAELRYYYPTNTLVTAPEIIFFWVARMIMAGYEFMGQKPFSEVYFTGIVRDKIGRKMSKQLGNSPDLLGLIEQYGADAVRFGVMVSSPAGNDLMFDEATLEQGRNFNNKVWNALKLVRSWQSRTQVKPGSEPAASANTGNAFAIDWFRNRLDQVTLELEMLMQQFRLSEALKTLYSLIWDDFCSWYLEWVKPGFEQPLDQRIYDETVVFFEELMHLLHPFMPFITEEIYHLLRDQETDLCIATGNPTGEPSQEVLRQGELLQKLISSLRDARNKNQVKPKDRIELHIQTDSPEAYNGIRHILAKQVNAKLIAFTGEPVANAVVVALEKDRFYMVSEHRPDQQSLKNDLVRDLQHQQNFLLSVQKKLGNERFVSNARPEVIELERKKLADARDRIRTIEQSLEALN